MEAETSKKPRRYEFWVAIAISLFAAVAFYFSTNPTLHDLDYTAEIASAFLRGDLGLREKPPEWLNEMIPYGDRYYSAFPLGAVFSMVPVALLQKASLIHDFPARIRARHSRHAAATFKKFPDAKQYRDFRKMFDEIHEKHFGSRAEDQRAEIVNYRLTTKVLVPKPAVAESAMRGENSDDAIKAHRKAYFDGWYDCPIYDRERLVSGNRLRGPAIIEQMDSTTVVHPGQTAHIDRFGNINSTVIGCS